MSKRHGSAERFVLLPHWMLTCAAWLALSPNGKAVLLHLWVRHSGSNNGQLVYGVREAQEIGLSMVAAARALAELIELGFLRVTRASGFSLKIKEARCWAITAEPIDGHPATREFMRWIGPKSMPPSHRKKFETQYPQGNVQYPQGNSDPENETKLPVSVPPGEQSAAKLTRSLYPQGNTSIIPCGSALPTAPGEPSSSGQIAKWRSLKFGDAAKAERTARVPRERQP